MKTKIFLACRKAGLSVIVLAKAGVFVAAFIFSGFIIASHTTFAAAPAILSAPQSININDQFTIEASMSGLLSNSIYRLRIVLAQTGTSNYFGSTHDGSQWYNGAPSPIDYSKFLSITTNQDGSWNGNVLGKLELNDSNYKNTGSGSYDLKLGRYTQSGSTATWSDVFAVNLTAPSATPTIAPTSKPISTNTPTPKPSSATPIPTKSPTPIKNSSPTTAQKTQNNTNLKTGVINKEVLGNKTNLSPSPVVKINDTTVKNASKDNALFPKIMIVIGIFFLILCGIVVSYPMLKKIKEDRFNAQ